MYPDVRVQQLARQHAMRRASAPAGLLLVLSPRVLRASNARRAIRSAPHMVGVCACPSACAGSVQTPVLRQCVGTGQRPAGNVHASAASDQGAHNAVFFPAEHCPTVAPGAAYSRGSLRRVAIGGYKAPSELSMTMCTCRALQLPAIYDHLSSPADRFVVSRSSGLSH